MPVKSDERYNWVRTWLAALDDTPENAAAVGATPVSGEIDGNAITLNGTYSPPGLNAMTITITGTIENDELNGTLSVQGMAPAALTLRRRAPGAAATDGGLQ